MNEYAVRRLEDGEMIIIINENPEELVNDLVQAPEYGEYFEILYREVPEWQNYTKMNG